MTAVKQSVGELCFLCALSGIALGSAAAAASEVVPQDPVPRASPIRVLERGRTQHTATLLEGGDILVAGGLSRESLRAALSDAERLRVERDGRRVVRVGSIRLPGALLPMRAIHATVALPDGRAIVAGGDASGTVAFFEPDVGPAGRFVAGPKLPGGPRAGLAATRLSDGRIWIAGGMRPDGSISDESCLLDPTDEEIVPGPKLVSPRAGHTATPLPDGRVFLAGGVGCETTELFDPSTGRTRAGPDLEGPRDDHGATLLLDGRVLLAGGQDGDGRSVSSAFLFEPETDRLVRVADLREPRADHAQVRLESGAVLLIGGERDDGEGGDEILRSVERFDPDAGAFALVAELAEPRDDAEAVVLPDGDVLVIGGLGRDGTGLDTFEWIPSP